MKTAIYILFNIALCATLSAAGSRPQAQHTPQSLKSTPPPPIYQQFLAVARKQIGVQEHPLGSNRGPEVDEYNRSAGAPLGSPWCASVQHWTGRQIGLTLPNAWSPSWFPQSRIIKRSEIRPGDFLGVPSIKLGRIAHIGVVERVEGNRVITLEGNTNAQGSREGHGYFRRSRLIESNVFSRWLHE